jgi:hypothetical protein
LLSLPLVDTYKVPGGGDIDVIEGVSIEIEVGIGADILVGGAGSLVLVDWTFVQPTTHRLASRTTLEPKIETNFLYWIMVVLLDHGPGWIQTLKCLN